MSPSPVTDGVQTRVQEIYARLKHLEGEMEIFDFRLSRAATGEDAAAVRAEHAHQRTEVARLRTEQQSLSASQVVSDLAVLAEHADYTGPVVVSQDDVDAVVFLAAFGDVSPSRVMSWLCRHPDGTEALLALVSTLCHQNRLPLCDANKQNIPVRGVANLPVAQQLHALAQIANTIGKDRLERTCKRLIRSREHELERNQATLTRHMQRKGVPGKHAAMRRESAERSVESCQRVLVRYRNVLAALTGEPVSAA